MADATVKTESVKRLFEQPADAITCYSDVAQILRTGPEIVMQFYETIPGPPSPPQGNITSVRSRLRATVILSTQHARTLGELLLKQLEAEAEQAKPGTQGARQ